MQRWAVTGTPLSTSLDGLNVLAAYLGLEGEALASLQHDYEDRRPAAFDAMADLLRYMCWRNTKQLVRDECVLPPLTRHDVHFDLDPLERALMLHELNDLRRRVDVRGQVVGLGFRNFTAQI